MNCREFAPWLQTWLDNHAAGRSFPPARNDPPALQEHLSQCQACREQYASAQRLTEGLKLFARPAPPPGLTDRILARTLTDRAARRRGWQRRLYFTYALAASILVMVIGGYFGEPGPKKSGDEVSTVQKDPPKTDPKPVEKPPEKTPEPAPVLAKTGDEVKSKVAALTGKLFDKAREDAKHLFAAAPAFEFPPMEAGVLPPEPIDPTASLRTAGQEISAGLQPVTRSARRAMDSFLRELSTFDVGGTP